MLVTYATAADHLNLLDLTSDPEVEASVTRMMAQAEAIVLTHVTTPDPTWSDATDPTTDRSFAIVQTAILNILGHLWTDRGDDDRNKELMTPLVVQLLSPLRDPSFA